MNEEILERNLPFYDNLSQADREALCYSSYTQTFAKEEVIIDSECQSCNSLLLVISGRLRCNQTKDGRSFLRLYYLFPGDFCVLAASAFLYGVTLKLTIISDEDDSTILKIPMHIYGKLNREYNEVHRFSRAQFTDRFSDIIFQIAASLFETPKERIAGLLAEKRSQESANLLRITQSDISSELCISRTRVSEILSELEKDNLIEVQRGAIEILEPDRLIYVK